VVHVAVPCTLVGVDCLEEIGHATHLGLCESAVWLLVRTHSHNLLAAIAPRLCFAQITCLSVTTSICGFAGIRVAVLLLVQKGVVQCDKLRLVNLSIAENVFVLAAIVVCFVRCLGQMVQLLLARVRKQSIECLVSAAKSNCAGVVYVGSVEGSIGSIVVG